MSRSWIHRNVPEGELKQKLDESPATCWFGLDFKNYHSLKRKEQLLLQFYQEMKAVVGDDLELLMVPDLAPNDGSAHLHFHGLVHCKTAKGLVAFRKKLKEVWKEVAGNDYLKCYFAKMNGGIDAKRYVLAKNGFARSSSERVFYQFG